MQSIPLTTRVPEPVAKWIRARAEAERRTVAWIVREVLERAHGERKEDVCEK